MGLPSKNGGGLMKKLTLPIEELRQVFASGFQENVHLSNYTIVRIGGKADGVIIAQTTEELESASRYLWEKEIPFVILGSGSNVLISEKDFHGVVIINHTSGIKIDIHGDTPAVWAESGASLGRVARQAAVRGLSGMEWASGIPGTIGGAVVGNAGAFGKEVKDCLVLADILHQENGKETWLENKFEYGYRTSRIKRNPGDVIILSARFRLQPADPNQVQACMAELEGRRQKRTPPGLSMGSTFRNPPGDKAGRLIEAAGLKGKRIGGAEISNVHANFFINTGDATFEDYCKLIQLAKDTVLEKFDVRLELEIEIFDPFERMN
jgi:UDP-N-acetylmuramate dehydrogenase